MSLFHWISCEVEGVNKLLTMMPTWSVTEIVPIAGEPNEVADGIPPTPNCIIISPWIAILTVTLRLVENTDTLQYANQRVSYVFSTVQFFRANAMEILSVV